MKLRLGMIGGGQGAFIGAVHRIASRIDDEYEMVCGAFSSNAERSKASGIVLGIDENRAYASYIELIEKESKLPAHQRAQVISIVTPNHVHFEPAKLALENGFHVILDKPMTLTLAEAKQLKEISDRTGNLLCLTHTYTGYPMVKQARDLVAANHIGKIRKVYAKYPQGWLSSLAEATDNKQATWRTDPSQSGIAGAMGDIGTHAFNLIEYVTGLSVSHLCADINVVVPGRRLDDDGAVLLRFEGGASGVLVATQVAAGAENNVQISIYGETGGIEWQQDDLNSLIVRYTDKPAEIWRTGGGYTSTAAMFNTRTPAGHPEGYLEAFANIYRNFALTIKAIGDDEQPSAQMLDYPGLNEGVRGMAFIENVIASGKSEQKWTPFTI
ncbi:Gfo/Idh/MocA family oxidoreductase [uncultured Mucilaginibacter sp.]|uniref:Gfo/Idh/MocA family protein n=1 Tax=uncultured Mucilaginibacter sp. TaxID=797541 RepID=UPI0025CDA5E8|nr:Gfo/Idh/MocA family oxidoreductase [uncultured Mucilaginibacter sp.]